MKFIFLRIIYNGGPLKVYFQHLYKKKRHNLFIAFSLKSGAAEIRTLVQTHSP